MARLLESGVDINCTDEDDWTALMNAAYWGRVKVAQVLMNFNADPHNKGNVIRSNVKRTAAEWARSEDYNSLADMLDAYAASCALGRA